MRLKDWIDNNGSLFIRRDLDFLLYTLLDKDYQFLLMEDYCLDAGQIKYLNEIKVQYAYGIPLAYLIKREEFFGRTFYIMPGVFIPRPETEIIVEKTLELIDNNNLSCILDLCCGSSCIGITLEKNTKKEVSIFASDISNKALEVSKKNKRLHNSSVSLVGSDLLSGFRDGSFDLIVSNPPYVQRRCIKGSLKHEPYISLDGGDDGLEFFRKILSQAPLYLKGKGYLILEIGYDQKEAVEDMIDAKIFKVVEWIKDNRSLWRGVILKKLT